MKSTSLESVLDIYAKHIIRINHKVPMGKFSFHSMYGERKAIAYYTAAANAVQALIDAPKPTWVDLKFAKSIRL
jgi:hypothetical protein